MTDQWLLSWQEPAPANGKHAPGGLEW